MWSPQRVHAEIRFVPDLLPGAGPERADPRSGKGKLVKEEKRS